MQRKERAKRACLVRLRTSQEASESGGSVQKGVGREGGGVKQGASVMEGQGRGALQRLWLSL